MLAMENSSRYGRSTSQSNSFKQQRSGYEPSDTETEWQESPWHDLKNNMRPRDRAIIPDRSKTPTRNISSLGRSMRSSSTRDYDIQPVAASRTSPVPRRNSRSPYKPRQDHNPDIYVSPRLDNLDTRRNISPLSKSLRHQDFNQDTNVSPKLDGLDMRRNISPFSKSERLPHISPYKIRSEEQLDDEESKNLNRKLNHRITHTDSVEVGAQEASRVSERSNYSRRSASVPKPRAREKDQQVNSGVTDRAGDRKHSPLSRNPIGKQREAYHIRAPSAVDINVMAAKAKLAKGTNDAADDVDTDSSLGDIFFSRQYAPLAMQKNITPKKNGFGGSLPPRPNTILERDTVPHQRSRSSVTPNPNSHVVLSSTDALRKNKSSSSAFSRTSSNKTSTESSKFTDASVRSSESLRKFTASRQKLQKDTWFGCMKKGTCKTSKTSEARDIDEASFIGKAFVVENLKPFWTEKHQPFSLDGFTCHKHQAQVLKQLVSHKSCPHILFKGPLGSGKKALTMALLHEIYGEQAWSISHELRHFQVKENRPMQGVAQVTLSPHHFELNLKSSKNARCALMSLVKEITGNAIAPDVSTASFRTEYKVLVLYEVDKVEENVQHMIKWIMDCYMDSCKLILCCEDDVDILDSVKNRCEVVKVDAPVTHEIMEVLIQIARQENIDLPMSFAAKIATKSKQNLRQAIMALEACKAHNYPFVDEQPIPFAWEEVLVELAAEVLADPSQNRSFHVRGKLQKLLIDFVHPKLILQKLVELFLKGVEASLKRELYYWHSYYEKRLPTGTTALLKLEEFVAKFMSIYRKTFRDKPYP
ncbi:hypothetical protein IFM89_021155 [Coptis chinensis]|uniref:Replication factor C subunit 3 n=1 Tax=Coptis chinensis TaxID=261450 RepID=A0A835I4Y3_9MAGN|nr:hypothetical protein IFM89_021155 [Coptis chinensis]